MSRTKIFEKKLHSAFCRIEPGGLYGKQSLEAKRSTSNMVKRKKSNKSQLANCLRSFERNVLSILGSSVRVFGGALQYWGGAE